MPPVLTCHVRNRTLPGCEPIRYALVERRQPPEHLRDQLRLELEIDGHKVRIWTIRPQWMRRDEKWHAWDPDENTGRIEEFVQVVDEDLRGGFWG